MRKRAVLGSLLLLAACDDDKSGGQGFLDGGADAPDAEPAAPVCVEALPALVPNDTDCPNPEPAEPDSLDTALQAAGLDRCTAIYTPAEWSVWPGTWHDPFRLPHFGDIHSAPLRSPGWAHETAAGLDGEVHPVANAVQLAAHRLGRGGDEAVCLPSHEDLPPLSVLIYTLQDTFGEPDDIDDIEAELEGVPEDLADALAPIVYSMEGAAWARDQAIASYAGDPADLFDRILSQMLSHPNGMGFPLNGANLEFLSTDFDAAAVYRAAIVLALTIENADLGRFAGATGFDVDLMTPLGRILIRDAAVHTYMPDSIDEPYALIVDTGGDDIYRVSAGATTTVDSRVALAIDLAGEDDYGYVEVPHAQDWSRQPADEWGRVLCHPCVQTAYCSLSMTERQGAARMGIGMLFDLGASDDTYRSHRMSQGFGAIGVGVLFDDGGDDTYTAESASQGASMYGIGLLLDQGGQDEYRAYQYSQGFGLIGAFGALRDGGADNDVYFCDHGVPSLGGDILSVSAQLPCNYRGDPHYDCSPDSCGNSSFCQGASFGRRDDFNNCSACLSGGIGLLRDNGGDDQYTAGVFAQGAGYWFGTGVLDDEAGNDHYDGLWYVQGATAHFALSVFRDGDGNDFYNDGFPVRNTSIGVGHDYSTSVHIDLGGDDLYEAPGLSLGSGNDNGHGYLFNVGGDDVYRTPEGRTLGGANTPGRPAWIKNVGIFVDVGGADTYDVSGATLTRGDDMTWIADGDDGDAIHAAGVDQGSGQITLP